MSDPTCCCCGRADVELRPYGPGGAWVCFACAMATSDRREETARQFNAKLDAAEKATGVATLTPQGPVPMIIGGKRRRR